MKKKTKIVGTIGPASGQKEVFSELVKAGLDIARLNFSHGDHEEQLERIKMIKEVREELNIPVAILLDTKGPEIRTGDFVDGKAELVEGQEYTLCTKEVLGDSTKCYVTYEKITEDIKAGDTILIDDGLISLKAKEVSTDEIICIVENSGTVKNKRGVNLPKIKVQLPPITQKDKEDIIFGVQNGIDFIAASFVRSVEAVKEIRDILKEYDCENVQIISKIENQEGLDNIDSIIEESDGIMVARGDLGVEIPTEMIPIVQKDIIKKCSEGAKPVITATHMLDSMIRNPRPTRAEVTDVANAIYDGTDAIMLSGETAIGVNPVNAVRTMAQIAYTTEQTLDYKLLLKRRKKDRQNNIASAVSFATCQTSRDLGAKAIVCATFSGITARMVSKFRPEVPILGITPFEDVQRKMQLNWGVTPVLIERVDDTDELLELAFIKAKELGIVEKEDLVVVSAGVPAGKAGMTNLMKVHSI